MEDNRQAVLKKWVDLINPNEDGTQAIYAAMDEYAQQQSIAFADWVSKYGWLDSDEYFKHLENSDEGLTNEQMYQLFLQSIK